MNSVSSVSTVHAESGRANVAAFCQPVQSARRDRRRAVSAWLRLRRKRAVAMGAIEMSRKEQPELLTGGSYVFIRHPIYSGLILAMLGSAIGVNIFWLVLLVPVGAYFNYSARREETVMLQLFPEQYAAYMARTGMLAPRLLRWGRVLGRSCRPPIHGRTSAVPLHGLRGVGGLKQLPKPVCQQFDRLPQGAELRNPDYRDGSVQVKRWGTQYFHRIDGMIPGNKASG